MKAIILTAGNGVRFHPLSVSKPKPLFEFFGKSILEYNLDALSGIVDEVFLIVHYKPELIKEKLGDSYRNIKLTYIQQKQVDGTGSAAKLASKFVEDKFLLLNGDDVYSKKDIEKIMKKFPSVLVKEVDNPSCFGIIFVEEGRVRNVEEKPDDAESNLANAALYYLPKSIFNTEIKKSKRGEYEFTDYLRVFIKKEELFFVKADFWKPNSYPWDLFKTVDAMFKSITFKKTGKIEKGAILNGDVFVGKGSVVKSGAYIEGPVYIGENCNIGPNCFIRPNSVIENNCSIGQAVEIKNSIIGKNTNINHLSYIGDSIIGENCNIGAGTITANLRHDNETIKTTIKDSLFDTKLHKLGTIIGDNVKTGIGTLIYPGRKIWPGLSTLPQEKVEKDKI